jgi:pimeloyl-ACP methyl ester carboxylesterase
MKSHEFHLAQANIARMRGPLESPVMEGFRSQLEHINAVADASAGFVWRLQTADGDATSIRVSDDERILFNMSVWESLAALHGYVYRSDHVAPLRSRRDWFEPIEGPTLVLWWVRAGHIPTVDEAKERLQMLKERGPTRDAFTFRNAFPPPGHPAVEPPEVDAEFCGSSF